jgi:hypothetical protein
VLETRTAGDPDDARIVFTDLSPACLSITMAKMGTPVCAEVIRHWMEEQALRLRKIAKDLAGGHTPERDAQFERIAALTAQYERPLHSRLNIYKDLWCFLTQKSVILTPCNR